MASFCEKACHVAPRDASRRLRSNGKSARTRAMHILCRLLAVLTLFALSVAAPALADPADIAAASRGVVRVVIIRNDGTDAELIGHGTGFAITPDLILTNAHVIEPLREDDSLVAGVVPPEGRGGRRAQVVTYSARNDLALLRIEPGSAIPSVTLFPGVVEDGSEVIAVGYPGNVDLAQGLSMSDLVTPQAAVKTRGYVSGGRSSRSFETLLHTAPIGSGNSGGPLLDACGRVVGVNSFGTISENGTDSAFYFAVSMREVLAFLRQAGVSPRTSGLPCRSIADLDRADAELAAREQSRMAAEAQSRAAARERALEKARRDAELEILSARDNGMALSALLLIAALAVGGAAFLAAQRGDRRRTRMAGGLGAALVIAAVISWFLRPSLSSIEERATSAVGTPGPDDGPQATGTVASAQGAGRMICVIDPARSRVTVSEITDVPFEWTPEGCVNNRTQYGLGPSGWSRILVPATEETVSVNSYDPASRSYTVERYLVGFDTMEKIRAERRKIDAPTCGAGQDAILAFGQGQQAILSLLPGEPNERMRYRCQPAP